MCFVQWFSCKTQSCSLGIRTLIFTGTSMSASHESRFALVRPLSGPGALSAVVLHKEHGSRLSSSTSRAVQTAEKRRRNSQQYFSSDLNAVGRPSCCALQLEIPQDLFLLFALPLISWGTWYLLDFIPRFVVLFFFVNSPPNTTWNLHQKIL